MNSKKIDNSQKSYMSIRITLKLKIINNENVVHYNVNTWHIKAYIYIMWIVITAWRYCLK